MIVLEKIARESVDAALIVAGWVTQDVGEFTRSAGLYQSVLKDVFSGTLFLQNQFDEPASAPLDRIPQKRRA